VLAACPGKPKGTAKLTATALRSTPDRSRAAKARCSAFHCSLSPVITVGETGLLRSPGTGRGRARSPPLDSPCRYSSGSTSVIFGAFRAHGGTIAGKPLYFTRHRISALVVDPRHGHLDGADAGQDLPRPVAAVAHHQAAGRSHRVRRRAPRCRHPARPAAPRQASPPRARSHRSATPGHPSSRPRGRSRRQGLR
jgi:hypothetical protein